MFKTEAGSRIVLVAVDEGAAEGQPFYEGGEPAAW
ncbi:hypothetical protein FHS56_000046 [Thermonema lapsum]|uniref:Uncharacterized protein n=1 Tax=Thermonema lapsum TaxID=28195 RepID=A0A846MMA9_9BACT|nr:hypothetical protein [Thermonema lapsum]